MTRHDELTMIYTELARLRAEVAALRTALAHYARDSWQPCDEGEGCAFLLLQHDPTVARQALGLNAQAV